MNNSTNIKIPKKYHHMINSISKDWDGDYWVLCNEGYMCEEMECGTISERTQKELLERIKGIIPERK